VSNCRDILQALYIEFEDYSIMWTGVSGISMWFNMSANTICLHSFLF